MKKFKFAPFDLSFQAFFPDVKLPAGVALGLNFPYCAFPFFILVVSYGLYLGGIYPFLFPFIFALISSVPTFLSFFLSKNSFKKINELIPSIPYITGFIVLITGFYLMNQNFFDTFSFFDFVNSKHSAFITIFVVFVLGILTSTGPATLPFIPVVAGILASNAFSKVQIFVNVLGFTGAFIISHGLIGIVSFYGFMVINQLFNVKVFNIVLGFILIFVGFNLLGLFGFSLRLPKVKVVQTGGFVSSFLLGSVYTFSICPSCTALLLGAVALSVASGNVFLAVLTMIIYAIGRSAVIFILGFLFNVQAVRQFIQRNYSLAKRFTGLVFIILSIYFIQKGF
ncbi:cytochrome c biogenesis CcdA family protein [Persephonella hydrogeniphila]|nr:cytochrome c biogenesis protein CcdA [Persephonella hydrogeniphila]